MTAAPDFDLVVVGGGPAGATAAREAALAGRSVLLLDRGGRIKPCGGAIPPRLIADFAVPDEQIVARISTARMVSPTGAKVDIAIEGGFVGMVDREVFDEWLRERAAKAGAERRTGTFKAIEQTEDGAASITYAVRTRGVADERHEKVRARAVIGADGARSEVARQAISSRRHPKCVFAYHEILEVDATAKDFDGKRCDVIYRGETSPDFYSWIFPHGQTVSVGTGTAVKGFSMRSAVAAVRAANGLSEAKVVRTEGAPIPLEVRKRWDNGRNVVLAGDAAGVVAPSSGEGIYYAMLCGKLSARAVVRFLETGNAKALAAVRREFLSEHGMTFFILRVMQYFWYGSDKRREQFVAMCRNPDVQRLTFESYMTKALVWRNPLAHVRIFFKDLAHLLGLVRA